MIVGRVVMRGVQETLVFRVGNGILIEPERSDMNLVLMISSGRAFPWILKVYSVVVHAFDFDSVDAKNIICFRDLHHSVGSDRDTLGFFHGNQLLR